MSTIVSQASYRMGERRCLDIRCIADAFDTTGHAEPVFRLVGRIFWGKAEFPGGETRSILEFTGAHPLYWYLIRFQQVRSNP